MNDKPATPQAGARQHKLAYPNLDLTTDTWTEAERAETVRWYEQAHGYGDTRLAPFVPFGIDYNPAGWKRYRALIPALTGSVPRGIFFTHLYAVMGNINCLRYEIVSNRLNGFTKKQVVETLNFAFIQGGPAGSNAVAEAMAGYLAAWEDEREQGEVKWPDNWSFDPQAYRSGVDITARTVELSAEELQSLRDWHQRISGAAPRYVDLWGRLRGAGYKAERARLEVAAIGTTLPVQIFPLMMMHVSAFYERPAGVLQGLRQARGLGVTLDQVVEIIDTVFVYGCEWKMAGVFTDEVVDFFEDWERAEKAEDR